MHVVEVFLTTAQRDIYLRKKERKVLKLFNCPAYSTLWTLQSGQAEYNLLPVRFVINCQSAD